MFDNKMKWSSHISNITRKANVVLHVIKRNLWNCPRDVKEVAYKSLVRPKLEYASTGCMGPSLQERCCCCRKNSEIVSVWETTIEQLVYQP